MWILTYEGQTITEWALEAKRLREQWTQTNAEYERVSQALTKSVQQVAELTAKLTHSENVLEERLKKRDTEWAEAIINTVPGLAYVGAETPATFVKAALATWHASGCS